MSVPVAVIKPDGVADLRVDEADEMSPRAEGPRFGVNASLSRKLRNEMIGDEITKLAQNAQLRSGWSLGFSFFHPCRVAGSPAQHQPFLPQPMGRL